MAPSNMARKNEQVKGKMQEPVEFAFLEQFPKNRPVKHCLHLIDHNCVTHISGKPGSMSVYMCV
jgi:hypothetical protein